MFKVTPSSNTTRRGPKKMPRKTKDGGLLSKESELYNNMRDVSSRDELSELLKQDGAKLSSLRVNRNTEKKHSERLSFPFDEDDRKTNDSHGRKKEDSRSGGGSSKVSSNGTNGTKSFNRNTNSYKILLTNTLQSVASALICTLLEYFSHFSFAAVIFSNPKMQGFVYLGFVANLVGYVISNIIYASFGTFKFGILSTPSFDVPVMAGAMTTIANSIQDETKLWSTAFVVVTGVSVLLGTTFMILGRLKLLAWTNFIPTPVISGFLAGNGVALMKSAFVISAGKSWNLMTPEHYGPMFTPQSIALYLPAVLFGTILSIGNIPSVKAKYSMAKPQVMFIILFILSNVIFYIVLGATGSSIEQAVEYGWLFELTEQAKSGAWWSLHELSYSKLDNVDWSAAVSAGFVPALTITIILLLGQAMRSAGTAEVTGVEGNHEHDSIIIGSANVVSGIFGGRVSLLSTASLLNVQLADANSRVTTWMCVVVGFIFLSIGHLLMAYAPKFICGGALFFLGVDITNQMVVTSYYKLPSSEFMTLLSVLAVYILINPMYGMGLGVFLTTGIFVHQYVQRSSESVITEISTGAMYKSTVHRSLLEIKMLKALSKRIIAAKLQGYLFFGNTAVVKQRLRNFIEIEQRNKKNPKDKDDVFLILNMHQVVGCDTTGTKILTQFIRQLKTLFNIHTICAGLNPSMYKQFNQHGLITQLPQFSEQDCTVLDSDTGHGAKQSCFFGFKRWQLAELEKRFCIFDDGTGRIELSDIDLLTTLLGEFGINATGPQVELMAKRLHHCYEKKRVGDARINWIKIFFRVLTATIEDNDRDIMYEVRSTIRYVDSAFGEEDSALQWVEDQLLSAFAGYMQNRQEESVMVLLKNSHMVMAEGGSRRHLNILPKVAPATLQTAPTNSQTSNSNTIKLPDETSTTSTSETTIAATAKTIPKNHVWPGDEEDDYEQLTLTVKANDTVESSQTSVNNIAQTNSSTNSTFFKPTQKQVGENVVASILCDEENDEEKENFEEYELFTQVLTSIIMEMELADRMVNGSIKSAIKSLRDRVTIEVLKAGDHIFQAGQTVHRIVIVLKGSLCVTKMLQQKSSRPPYRRMVRERVLVPGNILGHTHYYWKHRPIARWNAHAVSNDTQIACLKFRDMDAIHKDHSRLASFAHFIFCGDACRDTIERMTKYDAKREAKNEVESKKRGGGRQVKRRASETARHRRKTSK
jgi:MFS superfamily sulfate permease-like transporter